MVPIPLEMLCDRYSIDPHTGVVYDTEDKKEVPVHLEENRLSLSLVDKDNHPVEATIEDLLLITNYGEIGSPSVINLSVIPTGCRGIFSSVVTPQLLSLDIKKDHIVVNDKSYRQWRNTSYYVSSDGIVFNLAARQWLRINYDATGTKFVSIKNNDTWKTCRVPRMVWETYRTLLDKMTTLIAKNGRTWDARLENLRELTRCEKRAILHPEKYHLFDDENTERLSNDLLSNLTNREIADKYNLPIDYIWKLRTGRLTPKGFEDVGDSMKNRGRDKPLPDETVREIRNRKANGEKPKQIASDLNIGIVTVYQILQGKTYRDVV